MKLTSINGRTDRTGRHNDRNFDYEHAGHIDPERTRLNKTWNYSSDENISFREAELDFYIQEFSEHLEHVNERYRELRKPERIKTMEQYYSSSRSQPEDRIIQIGNYISSLDPYDLWDLANEYRTEFNRRFYPNCRIITMALHVDEATPHIHIRRVWSAMDKYGFKHVNQTKALKELGYDTRDPSRYNNAKKDFTIEDRVILYSIAKDYTNKLDISDPKHRRHLETRDFKFSEAVKLEQELNEKQKKIDKQMDSLISFYKDSGIFNDEELNELLSLPEYDSLTRMHELFMERITAINDKERDMDYIR